MIHMMIYQLNMVIFHFAGLNFCRVYLREEMRASECSDKTMKEYGLVGKQQMLLGLPGVIPQLQNPCFVSGSFPIAFYTSTPEKDRQIKAD